MKRFSHSLPTAIAALGSMLVLGCHRTDRTEPPEEDPSPLTRVEISPEWHLDQINSLYRDRARLASDDGAEYAASMRRTVDEAQAYVTELLDAHLRAYYLQRLVEYGDAFPGDPEEAKKYVAGIVAGHTNSPPEEVIGDMERIDATLPSTGENGHGVDEGADSYGDCPGYVDLISPVTNLNVTIDDRLPDGPWMFWLSS